MAEQPSAGRRGPREVVAQLKAAAKGAWASLVRGGDWAYGKGHARPKNWREVEPILLSVE